MTERWKPTAEPLVLHVIPTPPARGAQREARAVADQLDAPGIRAHRVLSLFEGVPEVEVDFSLHYPGGETPAVGIDPRLVLQVRTALRALDPTVVVAHGGDPLKYLVPAMVGRRRPRVYHAIGTFAGSRTSTTQLRLWRLLAKRADVVSAVGDEVAEECATLLNVPRGKVRVTPNGRDPDVFHPREAAGTDGPTALTFVGALTEGKRPLRFIEVVAAVRDRGSDVRALLVGDGPLREEVADAADRAGVDVLGSRSDVPEVLRRSDVLVFPSLPTGEGMPGVLIEAGLTGLPIVATDVPGVQSVLEPGVTGVVVGVDDLPGMVAAVESLVGDPAGRAAMGRAARERCAARWSLAVVGARWLELLGPFLPAGDRAGGR